MSRPPAQLRQRTLEDLTSRELDVLVIGGGIVGAGVARDAVLRGLRVGLIDQQDFAFGTSSRSSRLLHGGLRYLAQGRIGLVHEASVEKKIIHTIAPHLAQPLAFVFPTYRGNKDWVLWQLKLGVKAYDLLCGGRNLGKSTWLNVAETQRHVPGLRVQNLTGAVRYYDGFTNDARLVLDTLRSATNHGAVLLNYCRFAGARRNGLWHCELVDQLTGNPLNVRTLAVVNATGPWADGLPHSQVKLRATKGVHLVVERARVPVPDAVVMTEGKRILFAIPWGDRTILGTTDTDYAGSFDHVWANATEVAYVLRIVNQFFSAAKLATHDIISAWAGLRPLIANPNGTPSDISRSHEICMPEPGWWDVAGGKLTTYRLMAEQTVTQISKWLNGLPGAKRAFPPCRTAAEPLLPAAEADSISHVLPPELSLGAVEHFCRHEWAQHLDDVMLRRTSWEFYLNDAPSRAQLVAEWMAQSLGWDAARKDAELSRYHEIHRGLNSFRAPTDDAQDRNEPAARISSAHATAEAASNRVAQVTTRI